VEIARDVQFTKGVIAPTLQYGTDKRGNRMRLGKLQLTVLLVYRFKRIVQINFVLIRNV